MEQHDCSVGDPVSDVRRGLLKGALAILAAGSMALAAPGVNAQDPAYPTSPLTIVVTFTPGSTPDLMARILAPDLAVHLGQNVVVMNKPGAGGTIGLASVARAAKDGYTLGLVSPATIATAPAMYKDLPYDPVKDFTAVIKVATTPIVMLVPPGSPAKSAQDLLKAMGEKSKAYRYSSGGVGTAQHLQGALFAKLAGVSADHIPYRGQSEQLLGLVRGEVDYTFSSLPGAIGFVKDGRLRALGVTTPTPSASLPDVPSLSSAGLKGFEQSTAWFGMVVPSGTPDAVVETLHRAFVKTLLNPDVQAKLSKIGFDAAPPDRPGEFGQFIREQIPFWAELVRISGASAQ